MYKNSRTFSSKLWLLKSLSYFCNPKQKPRNNYYKIDEQKNKKSDGRKGREFGI
jgi:hypothetical protein